MFSYIDIGESTNKTIVFIHGLGSRKEAWTPQHELANKYRLVIPDLRSHGMSEINEDITVKNFTSDIIELLEHLEIESAFVCGLSLGGIVAQELYKQRPNMVKGLILANTTSYIPSVVGYAMNNGSIGYKNEDVIKSLIHNLDYTEDVKKAFYIRDTYLESARSAIGLNYYPLLMTIDKPVLLIGGAYDRITPPINLHTMKLFIRNVRTVVLEAGHMSNIENWQKFNEEILAFIGECA